LLDFYTPFTPIISYIQQCKAPNHNYSAWCREHSSARAAQLFDQVAEADLWAAILLA